MKILEENILDEYKIYRIAFLKLLKSVGAYEKYTMAIQTHSSLTLEELLRRSPMSYLHYFNWDRTVDGEDYWSPINDLWRKDRRIIDNRLKYKN